MNNDQKQILLALEICPRTVRSFCHGSETVLLRGHIQALENRRLLICDNDDCYLTPEGQEYLIQSRIAPPRQIKFEGTYDPPKWKARETLHIKSRGQPT